ncbi:MAG: DUF6089 family protein [Bacteroidales bacterium]
MTTLKGFRRYALVLTILCLAPAAHAQEYLFELGAKGGLNYYLGDVSTRPFSQTGGSCGLVARYNHNLRTALKLTIDRNSIHSSSKTEASVFPGSPYSFNRSFVETGLHFEYNFFSYSDKFEHMESKRFSPYVSAGIGIAYTPETKGMAKILAPTIPFGVGLKYKIKSRINIGLEYSMVWCSDDNLDGIKDPYAIKSSWIKNKDWYSTTQFFITFDFGYRKCDCPKGDY